MSNRKSSKNKTSEQAACQVCGVLTDGKIRCSTVACEACKRFYLRQRNRHEALVCVTGDGQCLSRSERRKVAAICWSGAVWRFLCPRCRYEKCVAVGMQGQHQVTNNGNKRPSNCSSSTTISADNNMKISMTDSDIAECSTEQQQHRMIITSLPTTYGVEMERNAMIVVQSAQQYLQDMKLAPLRASEIRDDNISHFDLYEQTIKHFHYNTKCALKYVKSLPGYEDIVFQDRCLLFINSLPKVTMASIWNCSEKETAGFAMCPRNASLITKNFPELAYVSDEVRHFMKMFNIWKLSFVDFAFLLAFLFYKTGFPKEQLADGDTIEKVEWHLRALYLSLKKKKTQQSDASSAEGLSSELADSLMPLIVGLFQGVLLRRYSAFDRVTKRCPNLVPFTKYYSELVERGIINWDKTTPY